MRLVGINMSHWSGEKVLLCQSPFAFMELVIGHVILHNFITGVKEHVAGCTRYCVLQVIHWKTTITALHTEIFLHGSHGNSKGQECPGFMTTLQKGLTCTQCGSQHATHICNRRTADSGTWWPQTSQRRNLLRQVSGHFHTSLSCQGPLCSDL